MCNTITLKIQYTINWRFGMYIYIYKKWYIWLSRVLYRALYPYRAIVWPCLLVPSLGIAHCWGQLAGRKRFWGKQLAIGRKRAATGGGLWVATARLLENREQPVGDPHEGTNRQGNVIALWGPMQYPHYHICRFLHIKHLVLYARYATL